MNGGQKAKKTFDKTWAICRIGIDKIPLQSFIKDYITGVAMPGSPCSIRAPRQSSRLH